MGWCVSLLFCAGDCCLLGCFPLSLLILLVSAVGVVYVAFCDFVVAVYWFGYRLLGFAWFAGWLLLVFLVYVRWFSGFGCWVCLGFIVC